MVRWLIISGTYVLVGCGQQKADVNDPLPAADLYTSSYFQCKRRYAEAIGQPGEEAPDGTPGWTILSARHDILWPSLEIESYDTTIEDLEERDAPVAPDAYQHTRYPWDEPLYETALDFWTRRVHFGLASWLGMKSGFPEEDPHCRRLIVVAGNRYVDPLQAKDVFTPFPWRTEFPFQEQAFDGIGEQMAWVAAEAARFEPNQDYDDWQQPTIEAWLHDSAPGGDRPPAGAGQSTWDDWL